MKPITRSLCLVTIILLAGCLSKPEVGAHHIWSAKNASGPALHYLGVGGWLIPWHDDGILMAPSFSNPALLGITGIPPIWVKRDEKRIADMMPNASFVSMILVGHAHYDHLLDVPEIAKNYAPAAKIYGSETAVNIMNNQLQSKSTNHINILKDMASVPDMSRPGDHGEWIYSRSGYIRAKPIRSMHAGHIGNVNLISGIYKIQPQKILTDIWDWRLGTPVAWLIDLLGEDKKPVYRIHYQDTAATPPWGFPPPGRGEEDRKQIDVAIICAGDWNHVHNYPAALLDYTKPRMVLIGHWENFFGNDKDDVRIIPFLDLIGIVDIAQRHVHSNVKVYTPLPFTKILFPSPEKHSEK